METKTQNYVYENVSYVENPEASRKFIANVFLWMFVALGISALCTYTFAFIPELSSMLRDPATGRNNIFGTITMFAPFILVLILSSRISKMSIVTAVIMFLAFSAIMGVSLSYIFYLYNFGTISSAFITASVVFGVMAIGGYTTNQDLTKFGSILIMLLVGGIIATVLNVFIFRSSSFDLLISYILVAVFVGLTAYDVQKLKRIGAGIEYGSAEGKKTAIMGALTLYLDFLNLFLLLLRIFGGNRR
ncbi:MULTISPECIES: Bax inhibitor-1/YccA family protein [unclassified Mucilaginibacter]|uniref:Bax inhibitor-1/YccA family protein n=1 Tax=unclassified Mucilaginibacter TaxID=2617802 RepID=UPI002AC9A010|nr:MULTISPECIES: Bax inhibitor-1/YccA family protein [unclassified Mucilaginibacter]MEB0248585.1 Bax inhibitor-1/YccA family protein [Mucilaginibacter sp. 5B2]MEB0262766.1 Bax inhibitor-1/YccA family protein [Mucilaginibacter sp. 10I4]MEB0280192.1 Bax inhibitor-1/YccA family protein [Mucilaginibacter sp. 10B2]MEB0302929.1 Bax inhibitor-1/YccA family protein [Mucilaginibacter sp. 5C4]WPX24399.1 Bax inhibitor-1/YccA family protein [Mucilaginibacter sp. 5C4]